MNEVNGKHVLITGGLGFLGSNLAIRLVNMGAKVTILDNLLPGLGGNEANIAEIKDRVRINFGDICDSLIVRKLIENQDIIFHLARQTDHIGSQIDPYPYIEINVKGTAVILEEMKKTHSSAKLVYTGTRGQYGAAVSLPVNETAATNPRGIYELTSLTAEKMIQIYHDVFGIPSVLLRLTNIYGPRSQMKHNRYGIVNWFIRLAMDGSEIPIFGDGSLKRDFLYVDDAIEAVVRCAIEKNCNGEIINIGNSEAVTFLELVKMIISLVGSGTYKFTPFSPERLAQEPGNFISDITKIKRLINWKPSVTLSDGIKSTIAYYQDKKHLYW